MIHLAAQAGVRYSLDEPAAYVNSNVVGTFNLLEIMRQQVPRHFLMASTSSVYGANIDYPFRETDATDYPVSLYAATKKSCEAMAHSYAHLFGIPTTSFRFFTVYGPWGRPDMALFKFVDAIKNGKAIDVYGHGELSRDFTYVADLVESIADLVEVNPVPSSFPVRDSLSPVAPYRTINIAAGRAIGLMDFIAAVEKSLGVNAVKNLLPRQPGDVVETVADSSLLRAITGTVPGTPLEEGVDRFCRWYEEYYDRRPERAV